MTRVLLLAAAVLLAACGGDDACRPPPEVQRYGMQIQSYYEDPTRERLVMTIGYRSDAQQAIYRNTDAASYRHWLDLEAVFYGLVNERYGHDLWPRDVVRTWTAQAVRAHPIAYAGDLDFAWAAWSATGDPAWVVQVADQTAHADAGIAGAARWSLRANYRQHRRVKQVVDADPRLRALITDPAPAPVVP